MKTLLKVFVLALFLVTMILLAPMATRAAAPALCGANPSTAVVGTEITITCVGFDPNTTVNTYVVDQTGFSEVGRSNYTACMVNSQGGDGASGKANEKGTATFYWYTQDGTRNNPSVCGNYNGYSNKLGTYTVVVQELDGVGGIKYKGTVQVTLIGNRNIYSGATLIVPASVAVYQPFTIVASGFTPNEYVSIWFTTPASCSGMGDWYFTAGGAMAPNWAEGYGLQGPNGVDGGNSTYKANSNGVISASFVFGDPKDNEYPCLGTWGVTVNALGSGKGAVAFFTVNGLAVANNAKVWTTESSVPSIGQTFGGGYGIGVHVYGSGFPAGSHVNCWFTRPDGTAGTGYVSAQVDAGGNFAAVAVTYTSDIGYQGEQLGRWAVTCGTSDGKYSGVAWFDVIGLLDP